MLNFVLGLLCRLFLFLAEDFKLFAEDSSAKEYE